MASTNCSDHVLGQSVKNTLELTGTSVFGGCISWLLFAFLITQTYTYYQQSKGGRSLFKALVYGIVLLQIVQTVADSYANYTYDADGWGNLYAGFETASSVASNALVLSDALTGFAVQCFFTWRIHSFSVLYFHENFKVAMSVVCMLILLVALLALSSGLASTIAAFVLTEVPSWWDSILFVWLTSSAATDLLITISMSCILWHARSQACFGETRDLIAKIVQLTIQTGLLTSGLAFLSVALDAHGNYFYSLPWFALGKSYALSLLVNLNACAHPNSTRQEYNIPVAQKNGGSIKPRVSAFLRSIGRSTPSKHSVSVTHINQPVNPMAEETRGVAEDSPPSQVSAKIKESKRA